MKRILAFVLIIMLILSGCSNSKERQLERSQLLAVGDSICTWGEAQVFILTQNTTYGETYGQEIWSVSLGNESFGTYIRGALLEYLKLLLLADYGARQKGYTLSEAEYRSIQQAAETLYGELGDNAGRLGILKEDVKNAYTHYAMAQMFYRQTMTDAQLEVSDEEARVISVRIISSPLEQGYEQAESLARLLNEGHAATELGRSSEGVSIRDENLIRGKYSKDFDTLVFSLKNGQFSPVIQEGDAYLIVQCLSSFLAAETQVRKAEMEQAIREETLTQALTKYLPEASILYNPTLWEGWTMESYHGAPAIDFFRYVEELYK